VLVDARYIYNVFKNQRPVALYSEYARALTFENIKVSRSLLTEGNGGGEGGEKVGGGRGEGGGGGGKRYYTCEHRNAVSVLKKRWTHHELRHLCWTHPRVANRFREAQGVEGGWGLAVEGETLVGEGGEGGEEGEGGEGGDVGLRVLVCGVGSDLSLIEHQTVDSLAALAAGGTVLFPALGLDLQAHNTSSRNLEDLLRLSSAGACPFFFGLTDILVLPAVDHCVLCVCVCMFYVYT
jgi:hypothetical protein